MIFTENNATIRLKWAFDSCKNGAWGEEPDGENDAVCIRAADFNADLGVMLEGERTLRAIDDETYRKVGLRAGDLVVEKSGGGEKQLVGRSVIYTGTERAVCSNFLARCRPSSLVTSEYLNYLMLGIYKARGTYPHIKQTTGIQNLDMGSFLNTRVNLPPPETQKRIAAFLDEKTAQIDRLMAKKQALLERLAEKRQALITQAVTKGLNPTAPMKDSGIDWLGQVPASWGVKRLRYLLDGDTLNGLYKPKDQFQDDGVPFVQMGEAFRSVEFVGGTKDRVLTTPAEQRKWGLKAGDFLIARRSLVFEGSGKSVLISQTNELHLFESSMIRLRLEDPSFSSFLSFYFQSTVCRAFILSITKQVTISGIDSQQLKNLPVPCPPKDEADKIMAHLSRANRRLDEVAHSVRGSIADLSEYRSALITAALTGQIEGLRWRI